MVNNASIFASMHFFPLLVYCNYCTLHSITAIKQTQTNNVLHNSSLQTDACTSHMKVAVQQGLWWASMQTGNWEMRHRWLVSH